MTNQESKTPEEILKDIAQDSIGERNLYNYINNVGGGYLINDFTVVAVSFASQECETRDKKIAELESKLKAIEDYVQRELGDVVSQSETMSNDSEPNSVEEQIFASVYVTTNKIKKSLIKILK